MRGIFHKGYTIIELMVAIAIMGIMIAAISPAVTSAMADGRAADAAVDIVRLVTAARAEARVTGMAHVIVYDAYNPGGGFAGDTPVGRLRLFRGELLTVNPTPPPDNFSTKLTTCNPDRWNFANMTVIDGVDLTGYNIRNSSHWITLEPVDTDNTPVTETDSIVHQICYQPDGRMMLRTASATSFAESVDSVSDPIFAVFHKLNGAQAGVPRQVIFTFGGNARIRR